MATAYKCDICGALFERDDVTHSSVDTRKLATMRPEGIYNYVTFFTYAVSHPTADSPDIDLEGHRLDVCSACTATAVKQAHRAQIAQ